MTDNPFDALADQSRDVPRTPLSGDPYDGPTPDLDDLPLPDEERLDRQAEARVAEVWGAA